MTKPLDRRLRNREHDAKRRQEKPWREFYNTQQWKRDNYIRKDDFIVYMKQHDDLLRLYFANIRSRLERIEKQLDQKA